MLNQPPPAAALVYSNTLAANDLGVAFRLALETLQLAMQPCFSQSIQITIHTHENQ
ncbi:hypothetical protein FAES_4216 [Fibrella aestuarina BUZ 2]|uniref:Uncharacterized protein n=1 Tax=Fibrella aestuarina BUZ 2 TaxID=1166018 RepID=I0KDL3_9BACT|nr:hypothetical protein FAES_4216 [Fibrella aestuarina BUZ 2]